MKFIGCFPPTLRLINVLPIRQSFLDSTTPARLKCVSKSSDGSRLNSRRSVHEFPADARGAGEQEQAAPPAGPGDRRSGLGHLQAGPVHPAADAAPGTPHHAAVPHPARQVRSGRGGDAPKPEAELLIGLGFTVLERRLRLVSSGRIKHPSSRLYN